MSVGAKMRRGQISGIICAINVAWNRNGVGCGAWTHIDGWSEAVIEYIAELETAEGAVGA
jgi:hypothetical protein